MPEILTHAGFSDRLGETFRLSPGEAEPQCIELELIAARAMEPHPGTKHEPPFTLEFRGPREPVLPQGVWPLEHSALGTIEIFLVPVGPDDQGNCYEAVFN